MESTSRKRFGIYLRNLREAQKMTQEDVAKKTGFHATYIAKIEAGNRLPSLDAILSLAKALHVPAAHLMAPLDGAPKTSSLEDELVEEIVALLRGRSAVQLNFVLDFIRLVDHHSQ